MVESVFMRSYEALLYPLYKDNPVDSDRALVPPSKKLLHVPVPPRTPNPRHTRSKTPKYDYLEICRSLECKPNNTLVEVLEGSSVTELNLEKEYLGSIGFLALIYLLKYLTDLSHLSLRGCSLTSLYLIPLCDAMKHHPTPCTIDLRGNTVGECGALMLLQLAQLNPNILRVQLDTEKLTPSLQEKLRSQFSRSAHGSPLSRSLRDKVQDMRRVANEIYGGQEAPGHTPSLEAQQPPSQHSRKCREAALTLQRWWRLCWAVGAIRAFCTESRCRRAPRHPLMGSRKSRLPLCCYTLCVADKIGTEGTERLLRAQLANGERPEHVKYGLSHLLAITLRRRRVYANLLLLEAKVRRCLVRRYYGKIRLNYYTPPLRARVCALLEDPEGTPALFGSEGRSIISSPDSSVEEIPIISSGLRLRELATIPTLPVLPKANFPCIARLPTVPLALPSPTGPGPDPEVGRPSSPNPPASPPRNTTCACGVHWGVGTGDLVDEAMEVRQVLDMPSYPNSLYSPPPVHMNYPCALYHPLGEEIQRRMGVLQIHTFQAHEGTLTVATVVPKGTGTSRCSMLRASIVSITDPSVLQLALSCGSDTLCTPLGESGAEDEATTDTSHGVHTDSVIPALAYPNVLYETTPMFLYSAYVNTGYTSAPSLSPLASMEWIHMGTSAERRRILQTLGAAEIDKHPLQEVVVISTPVQSILTILP